MIKWMILVFPFMLLAGILCYLFDINPWPLSLVHPGMLGWILVLVSQSFMLLGLVLGESYDYFGSNFPER